MDSNLYFGITKDLADKVLIPMRITDVLKMCLRAEMAGQTDVEGISLYVKDEERQWFNRRYHKIYSYPDVLAVYRLLSVFNNYYLEKIRQNLVGEMLRIFSPYVSLDKDIINLFDTRSLYYKMKKMVIENTKSGMSFMRPHCESGTVLDVLDILSPKGVIMLFDLENVNFNELMRKIHKKQCQYIATITKTSKIYRGVENIFNTPDTSKFVRYTTKKIVNDTEISKTVFLVKRLPEELRKYKEISQVYAVITKQKKDGVVTAKKQYFMTNLDMEVKDLINYTRKKLNLDIKHLYYKADQDAHRIADIVFKKDSIPFLNENLEKNLETLRKLAKTLHKKFLKDRRKKKPIKSNMFNCYNNERLIDSIINNIIDIK